MNQKRNNILILGATGFIGHVVYNHFRAVYPEWIIYVLVRSKEKSKAFNHSNTKVYIGTLESFNWKTLPEHINYIFHFARNASSRWKKVGRYLASVKGWYGNRRLMNYIKTSNVKHLFYMSGSLMYGHQLGPVEVGQPLSPVSFAREYQIAEKPVTHASEQVNGGCKVSIIRVPWVLGEGSWFQTFFKQPIDVDKYIPQYGNGKNIMAFIQVNDIALACQELLEGIPYKNVYHLTYKNGLTQVEFVNLIKSHTRYPVKHIGLSGYEEAIQEAFNSSIPLSPSSEFSFSTAHAEEKISAFLQDVL